MTNITLTKSMNAFFRKEWLSTFDTMSDEDAFHAFHDDSYLEYIKEAFGFAHIPTEEIQLVVTR